MKNPCCEKKSCRQQFRAAYDGSNRFRMDRMDGEQQSRNKSQQARVGSPLQKPAQEQIHQQSYHSVKQQVNQMKGEGTAASHNPVQRKTGKSQRTKYMTEVIRKKQLAHRVCGDRVVLENIDIVILS